MRMAATVNPLQAETQRRKLLLEQQKQAEQARTEAGYARPAKTPRQPGEPPRSLGEWNGDWKTRRGIIDPVACTRCGGQLVDFACKACDEESRTTARHAKLFAHMSKVNGSGKPQPQRTPGGMG